VDYKELIKQIKDNNFCSIYFYYGEEKYLLKHYVNEIKDKVLVDTMEEFNFRLLEDSSATSGNVIEFCDSYPVMSQKKLLIIKNCDYFKGKKNDAIEELIEYLKNIPEYVHVLFIQDTFDKKSSLYKFVNDKACCVEFKKLDEKQLQGWCAKQIKEDGMEIDIKAAQYLVEILEGDMQKIKNESLKLSSYAKERGIITIDDVKMICIKSLSYEVFEMVDYIIKKNIKNAILQLNEILNSKESEIKILGLIIWNMRTLHKVKLAIEEGIQEYSMPKRLGISFVSKYISQANGYSLSKLQKALILCSEADIQMKSTGIDNKIILEKLIIQIAN